MKQNTFIMAIMLSASILVAGCTDKRYPVTIPVSADITAAVYAAPTEQPGAPLIEETVHVSKLVRYNADNDSITVPFNFSDTAAYAKITEDNLGKPIALSINGEVVYTPVVKMRLANGACSAVISTAQASRFFPSVAAGLQSEQ